MAKFQLSKGFSTMEIAAMNRSELYRNIKKRQSTAKSRIRRASHKIAKGGLEAEFFVTPNEQENASIYSKINSQSDISQLRRQLANIERFLRDKRTSVLGATEFKEKVYAFLEDAEIPNARDISSEEAVELYEESQSLINTLSSDILKAIWAEVRRTGGTFTSEYYDKDLKTGEIKKYRETLPFTTESLMLHARRVKKGEELLGIDISNQFDIKREAYEATQKETYF